MIACVLQKIKTLLCVTTQQCRRAPLLGACTEIEPLTRGYMCVRKIYIGH